MNNELLDAMQFVPNAFKDNFTMKKIVELFNLLMDRDLNANSPILNELQYAYYDATYKFKDYSKISFKAKMEILHEMGYDYITDFINITDNQLTQLLSFLSLIYILKGKKEGLELILNTLGIIYTYTTWDEEEPKGCPFTAQLVVTGGNFDNYQVMRKLKGFLRSYMLPWIDVSVVVVIEAPPMYIYPSHGRLIREFDTRVHNCARDVDQRIAVYDIDDGNGYDWGLYGRETLWATGGEVPEPKPPVEYATLKIVATPINAKVQINNLETNSATVESGTIVSWRVYTEDGLYEEQSGNLTLLKDTELKIDLQKIQYTLTITSIPASAKIEINGEQTNKVTAAPNTELNWSVSLDGYKTKTGTEILTQTKDLVVSLEKAAEVAYKCYKMHFSIPGTTKGNAYDFTCIGYIPVGAIGNTPVYFNGARENGINIAIANEPAASVSNLFTSIYVLLGIDNMAVFKKSPYVATVENGEPKKISSVCVMSDSGATQTFDTSEHPITRLPEYDLSK